MLSVWPELFTYQLIAVSLLRITASYFFLLIGIRLFTAVRHAMMTTYASTLGYGYALAHIVIGSLLCVGAFTQPTALAGAVLMLVPWGSAKQGTGCEQHLRLLLFTVCVSLLFLGPGLFAVDIPL